MTDAEKIDFLLDRVAFLNDCLGRTVDAATELTLVTKTLASRIEALERGGGDKPGYTTEASG